MKRSARRSSRRPADFKAQRMIGTCPQPPLDGEAMEFLPTVTSLRSAQHQLLEAKVANEVGRDKLISDVEVLYRSASKLMMDAQLREVEYYIDNFCLGRGHKETR